jgi:hypothetical protein
VLEASAENDEDSDNESLKGSRSQEDSNLDRLSTSGGDGSDASTTKTSEPTSSFASTPLPGTSSSGFSLVVPEGTPVVQSPTIG